eukprot:COSAG01_NODE_6237_length_3775_cov_1.714713_3_plen_75_part_00
MSRTALGALSQVLEIYVYTEPRTKKSTQNSHLASGWSWDRVYSTLGVELVIKVPVVHLSVPFGYSVLRAHLGHT